MKQSFIDWAMEYRKIVIFIVSVLILLGIYGLYEMPKDEFPSVEIRQGVVVALYPGATSVEVEEQLTKPLEDFIFGFKEVKKEKVISQSRDGIVYIMVELGDQVKERDVFWSKFRHSIDLFKSSLPSGVLAIVVQDDFGDTSSILLTLESDSKTYAELSDYMDILKSRLRRIQSVGNLRVFGMQDEQISVYLDETKMAGYAISPAMISAGLSSGGFTMVSSSMDNANLVSPIHIRRDMTSVKDVEDHIVYYSPDGKVVRIGDVARVVREYADPSSYITNNGHKAILLSVEMRAGNNIVKMGEDVNGILEKFDSQLPDDISIYHITDQSQVVGKSVTDFLRELLIAILSVVLVVILIMPLKVALVAASSIPITIFISLAIFYLCGIELNTVSLAALIITLGMIVDNSIVIIDSYLGMLDSGEDRRKAATDSAKQFLRSIISATLAISVTFFPFLVTTEGTIRDFIVYFPWATTVILFVSLLVAVLLIPYFQYSTIKKGLQTYDGERPTAKQRFLATIQSIYDSSVERIFRHPARSIVIGLVALVGGILLFNVLPMKMMPVANRNQFAVEIYLPVGTSLDVTKEVAKQMEDILDKDPRVVSITSFVGCSSPRFHTAYAPIMPGSHYAQFIVNTVSDEATEDVLDEYEMEYYDYFPNAIIRFKQIEYNDAANPIEVRVGGEDWTKVKEAAQIVEKIMREQPDMIMVRSDLDGTLAGTSLDLDNAEMNRLGISQPVVAIHNMLRYGAGIPAATIWEGDRSLNVVLKTGTEKKDVSVEDMYGSYLPSYAGLGTVQMKQIAKIDQDWNDGQIVRRNGIPTITVMSGIIRGKNVQKNEDHLKEILSKTDFPEGVSVTFGGNSESANNIVPQMVKAMILSVVIILFILLFHLKDLKTSFLILGCTVFFALPGTSFSIWVMGYDICVTSFMGVVSLMGIIVRNCIIMTDYARELMASGQDIRQAVMDSAKRRMRPIFLTSAAASMGVVPMILSGSPLWSPMGVVVFFGTWISMLFVLEIYPIVYFKLCEK